MAHVRDRSSLRESVEITTPSGNRYRWADDEDNAANVPSGERFTDTMPGGFAEHDAVLPRKPAVDYADLERLSTITRYDASGGIIWQGRLERAPKVSGDQIAISPSAVGWQAHLEDNKSAMMVYRDVRLSEYGGMSTQRQIDLTNYTLNGASVTGDKDSGNRPALVQELQGPWAVGATSESIYRSPTDIASVYYEWRQDNANFSAFDWGLAGYTSDRADGASLITYSGDLQAAGPGSGTLTLAAGARYLRVFLLHGAANTAGSSSHKVWWQNLAVYGSHGLTVRGTEPDAGFYDADIIRHAVETWCPLLTVTDESITAASVVIPQAAFLESTTAGEIVRQANRFGLRDWAVWDGPTFWLHDRGARGTAWRARVGPSGLEETGPQVDRLWESVIVAYQDVDGSTRTVGPIGSGADTETDDLKDDDPDNPANKLGITRRDMLSMGASTAAGATEVGRRFLEETKALDSSGRARITGHVQDSSGVWHPYSHVRSGDTVTFVDASDTSARRVVRTDKSRDDRSCSIDLDSPPEGLQALLERLGVVLVPLGI